MATIDQANNVKLVQALPAFAYNATPAITAIDTQGYEAVTLLLNLGPYTDGDFKIYLQDSPDDVTYTFVSPTNNDPAVSGFLIPPDAYANFYFPYSATNATVAINAMNAQDWTHDLTAMAGNTASYWIGYVGINRYIKPQVVISGMPMTGMYLSMDVLLGWPHTAPTRLVSPNAVG